MQISDCGFEEGLRVGDSRAFINPESAFRIPHSEIERCCLTRAARVKLLQNHERPARTPESGASNMPRVLIADDQPAVIEALRLMHKGEGFETRAIASPSDVAEAL